VKVCIELVLRYLQILYKYFNLRVLIITDMALERQFKVLCDKFDINLGEFVARKNL
jgi:hypothetical protein